MSTATVNGTSLYYDQVGTGPVCLVLHGGLGVDHTLYRDFDRLGTRVRLTYYDQRGNGRSARPPLSTLTIPQLADDAAALADHLGAERVHVIGHSYGGFVAQELAIRHPDRLHSLVLVATSPGGPGRDESLEDFGPPPPADLAAAFSSAPETEEEFAAALASVLPYYVRTYAAADLAQRMQHVVLDAATMVHSMRLLETWSVVDQLAGISAPTLVLVGHHDVVTSPAQARRIARHLPGSTLVEFAESSHLLWLDQPTEFFAVLDHWFAERSAAGLRTSQRWPSRSGSR